MADDYVEVLKSRLTLSLGGTISVHTGAEWNDWIKPSCGFSIDFKGIPGEEQLRLAAQFIQAEVLAPVLENIIIDAQDKLSEVRKIK